MTLLQALQAHLHFFYLLSFVFGLCIGSFLNVVILRLPPLIDDELAAQADKPLPNLAKPGSHCPNCKQAVRWYDNIPVVSYLCLRAKCRNCQQPISPMYLLVEVVTASLFFICALKFGPTVLFFWAILITSALIALSWIDLNTWLLPDCITLPGIALGLVANSISGFVPILDSVIGAFLGYFVLWIIYQVHHRLTGREGMGYGDFKLLAMLGAWLGWQALPLIMLLSSLAAIVIFLLLKLLARLDLQQPIPFGPFLSIAGWLYMIFQTELIQLITH